MPIPTPAPSRPVVGLPLTDREREVLDLVSRPGGSRKVAAVALGLSRRRVDTMLTTIFARLECDNIAAAARELGRIERSG